MVGEHFSKESVLLTSRRRMLDVCVFVKEKAESRGAVVAVVAVAGTFSINHTRRFPPKLKWALAPL